MKVAIFASDYPPSVGGVQTATQNLAKELKALGHDPRVFSTWVPGAPFVSADFGVPIRRFRWALRPIATLPLRFAQTAFRLLQETRSWRPDVVYVHFVTTNAVYALLVHAFMRVPLVPSVRGNDVRELPERSLLQRIVLWLAFRRAAAVIGCAPELKADISRYAGGREAPFHVVGDGVPDGLLHVPVAPVTRRTIFGFGRLVRKKGFDLLLQAYAQAVPRGWRLCLAGDGPEAPALHTLADRLGISEQVEFLGALPHSDTMHALSEATIAVIPSRDEPFGIAAIEAMALAKPVIATRVGGLQRSVVNGHTGVLVEPTVEALRDALQALTSNVDLAGEMGLQGRMVAQTFTWRTVAERYIEVLSSAASC